MKSVLHAIMLSVMSPTAVSIDLTTHPEVQTAVVTDGQGYFPVIDKAPNGRAVVVLRGGGGYLGIGGRLDLFFSKNGIVWFGKHTIVDTSADDRNPAFGITPKGRFFLGFHQKPFTQIASSF